MRSLRQRHPRLLVMRRVSPPRDDVAHDLLGRFLADPRGCQRTDGFDPTRGVLELAVFRAAKDVTCAYME
eukprot:CAMPEP_0196162560 /NCGR_PEP_ID=MMETSP0910-20130528/47898_1 /TAXON_ID=49265 /ORGANISM="Thalassiosira rotula, Strain GSO102" /LENGTH=69 /DNA_ID=CAMNT_0041427511 /DNA_START=309 /DNA_END=518 /DNA_ORIENTATION=+